VVNNGAFNLTAGSGNNSFLNLTGTVTLSGRAALTISSGDQQCGCVRGGSGTWPTHTIRGYWLIRDRVDGKRGES